MDGETVRLTVRTNHHAAPECLAIHSTNSRGAGVEGALRKAVFDGIARHTGSIFGVGQASDRFGPSGVVGSLQQLGQEGRDAPCPVMPARDGERRAQALCAGGIVWLVEPVWHDEGRSTRAPGLPGGLVHDGAGMREQHGVGHTVQRQAVRAEVSRRGIPADQQHCAVADLPCRRSS